MDTVPGPLSRKKKIVAESYATELTSFAENMSAEPFWPTSSKYWKVPGFTSCVFHQCSHSVTTTANTLFLCLWPHLESTKLLPSHKKLHSNTTASTVWLLCSKQQTADSWHLCLFFVKNNSFMTSISKCHNMLAVLWAAWCTSTDATGKSVPSTI